MGRDDFRSLAYRHLSFALRGCGQVREADEAYRRALKYEQRAAPSDSPKTKTKGGTTAAKLLYDSELTDGGGDDEEDIMKKHHNTLIDSKHHDPPVSAAAVAVAEHLRDLTRGPRTASITNSSPQLTSTMTTKAIPQPLFTGSTSPSETR